MVQGASTNKAEELFERLGEFAVSVTGLRISGWVIVHEDDRRCVMAQHSLYHLSRIDVGRVERSLKDLFEGDDAMPRIQQQQGKNFALLMRE